MFVLYYVCICLCNMFVLYCVYCAHPFDDHSHTTCLMNGDIVFILIILLVTE